MYLLKKLAHFVVCIGLLYALPTPVHAESINSFDTHITVTKDGQIDVTEKITYDFGSLTRHGIIRDLVKTRTNQEGKKFEYTYTNFTIKSSEGALYTFTTQNTDDILSLKIGDADRTITGVHTYIISYRISGALTYFSDHDELSWNITGNGWGVPIMRASTQITLPEDIPAKSIAAVCYTGTYGSTQSMCTYEIAAPVIVFTLADRVRLGSNEGLTVGVKFDKGIVAVLEPKEIVAFETTPVGKAVLAVIFGAIILGVFTWYIILPLWIVFRWYFYGRDPNPPVGEASVWFSPPKRKDGSYMTPAEMGALHDEAVDTRDIMSTLIDLARRGYLSIIVKKNQRVTFVKKKSVDVSLVTYEATLLSGLFDSGDTVTPAASSLYATVTHVKNQLYERIVALDLFPTNPEKQRTKYQALAIFGFLSLNFPLLIIGLIFGTSMPRKTLVGAQAAAVSRALKSFLTSQEKYYKGMGEAALVFENLLPYAVAFGVERTWAARFSDLTLPKPDWYAGDSSTFTTSHLMHSLQSTMTTVGSASAAMTTTRSSSGFSSSFSSGGGFSGGGGGGGGGSSW